jgi:hypothetical protein
MARSAHRVSVFPSPRTLPSSSPGTSDWIRARLQHTVAVEPLFQLVVGQTVTQAANASGPFRMRDSGSVELYWVFDSGLLPCDLYSRSWPSRALAFPDLPFLPKADSQAKQAPVSASKLFETPPSVAEQPPDKMPHRQTGSTAKSFDTYPLDRSMDRLLAAIGLLDDALPVFAPTRSLPRAGVLLAIPALVASGLLSTAEKIYGSLGPAFYGLRTTLVAYVLLALLRIPRPKTLKEYPPGELGRIIGLDRMPEMKTLRRKLARLASLKGSYRLGREVARQRIAKRGKVLGFLYIDGHVRAYHGKHKVPKAYVTRMHLAAPQPLTIGSTINAAIPCLLSPPMRTPP